MSTSEDQASGVIHSTLEEMERAKNALQSSGIILKAPDFKSAVHVNLEGKLLVVGANPPYAMVISY